MPRKSDRLSRKQLATEAENQLRDNAKKTLMNFWNQVNKKLDSGDTKTMEMVGRMFQYDKGPGGVTIFNQHLQVNGAQTVEQTARARSFDQIVNQLEDIKNMEQQNRLIAAPVGNSEEDNEDEDTEDEEEIQEAETEDIDIGELVAE